MKGLFIDDLKSLPDKTLKEIMAEEVIELNPELQHQQLNKKNAVPMPRSQNTFLSLFSKHNL